jgi:A/G-specific adenine glycosylase
LPSTWEAQIAVGRLLAWYAAERRDLPWRREPRTPYRVLVAETMLQQTRAEAVAPRYEAFLQRFPDLAALADAPLDEVLRSWEGLGYYARARNLHRMAAELCARGGEIPCERQELLRLSGVGPYIASAVRCFAFDVEDPPLDANLRRIALRVSGTPGAPMDAASAIAARDLFSGWFSKAPPAILGDALMDLGARICTARRPRCSRCPLADSCAASASGDPEAFGVRAPKTAPRLRRILAAQITSPHGQAWRPRPGEGLLGGLWEPPHVFDEARVPSVEQLLEEVRAWGIDDAQLDGTRWPLRHAFTHQVWEGEVVRLVVPAAAELSAPARWLDGKEIANVAIPRAFRAVLGGGG